MSRFNQVLANYIKPQFQLDPSLLVRRVIQTSHLVTLYDILRSGCIRQRPQSLGGQVPPSFTSARERISLMLLPMRIKCSISMKRSDSIIQPDAQLMGHSIAWMRAHRDSLLVVMVHASRSR